MEAQVVGFVSGKGGTGKTTTAVMVGGALARLGKKVLLIELDSGLRSVDIVAGVNSITVFDLHDIFSGQVPVEKAVVQSPEYPGLSVISAPYQGRQITPPVLAPLLGMMKPRYDYILLDTAAGIGGPYQAAFHHANSLILVLTPDRVALRDGRLIADEAAERGLPVRLLVNRVVPERIFSGGGLEDLDQAIDLAGAQLIGVVPESQTVQSCGANGRGLPQNSQEQAIYSAIARRIVGEEVPLVYTDEPRPFWRR